MLGDGMKSALLCRSSSVVAMTLFAATATACDTEYTAPPTPCDDWCRATMRADCEGNKPHECVSDCIAEPDSQCGEPTRALTNCYAAAADDDFHCDGPNGKSIPNAGVCQAEHDALFACQKPALYECLNTCAERARAAQQAFSSSSHDAETTWGCPSLNDDCVCACYTLDFLSVAPTSTFFDCLESTTASVCPAPPSSPAVQISGNECKPPGIFSTCTDAAAPK
jgi:hypothetical protein